MPVTDVKDYIDRPPHHQTCLSLRTREILYYYIICVSHRRPASDIHYGGRLSRRQCRCVILFFRPSSQNRTETHSLFFRKSASKPQICALARRRTVHETITLRVIYISKILEFIIYGIMYYYYRYLFERAEENLEISRRIYEDDNNKKKISEPALPYEFFIFILNRIRKYLR